MDPKKKNLFSASLFSATLKENNRPERLIANSVGGGGLWVCNLNGNIENDDYIQSTELRGRGEKQDDDSLHNYTVATATMDCSFKLDSSYYRCHEILDSSYYRCHEMPKELLLLYGVRVAFIAL